MLQYGVLILSYILNVIFLPFCRLVADGRHMHPGVQVLLGEDGTSAPSPGPRRAVQHSQGHRGLGARLRGSDIR